MARALIALFLAVLSSCSKEKAATPAPPPVYETIHHPKLNGAVFHFKHDGKFYLACSRHQGGASPGTKLVRKGQDEAVVMKKKVHQQKDLHVWTYEESTLNNSEALNYTADPNLQVGDRVYLLNRGQKIAATVVAEPKGENFRYSYQTDNPFPAGGMSGSPVYLPRLGSVVGVLQTANDKKKATFGGFELLKMP